MCGGAVFGGDVYIQPGGRILHALSLQCPGTPFSMYSTGIIGLTSSGQLDTVFGNNGTFLLASQYGINQYAGSAMQPDDKLLVYYETGCPDCGLTGYRLIRLNANGTADPAFTAVIPTGGNQTPLGVAVASDGKITVFVDNPSSLIRLNPDGSRDQTFGSNGVKLLPATRLPNTSIAGMVIDERGGTSFGYTNGAAARFNSDGELDRSFGRQGVATEYLGAGRGVTFGRMVRQPDGKLLFSGYSTNPQNVVLFRYTQRGRPDATFGSGGIVDRPVGPGASTANGVAFLSDGRIVVTGTSTANGSAGVLTARYAYDGTLERFARTSFPDQAVSAAAAIAVGPDGKIVAAGNAGTSNLGFRFIAQILRFTDSDFGKAVLAKLNDFDGDGRTDLSVYRTDPAGIEQSYWAVLTQYGNFMETDFGVNGDVPVPQDYDGDGKTDIAVFRPSNGTWYYKTNISVENFTAVQFGQANDIPIPNDFDGDGNVDLAVYRPSTSTWYIRNSLNGAVVIRQFGNAGDTPITGDFDGDGKADLTVWNSVTARFTTMRSSDGLVFYRDIGAPGDIPVIADYDGDRIADLAAYTPGGVWRYVRSLDGQQVITSYGAQGDIPVPGDYNGDGKAEIAVFRPSEGNWYVTWPTNNGFVIQFGQNGDVPLPGR